MVRLATSVAAVAALLLVLSPAAQAEPPKKNPEPITVPNGHGLRIPAGGTAAGPAPGGGGKIVVYNYTQSREVVAGALRKLLVADKWTIDSERKSPRGSVRLQVSRGGKTVKLSIAGAQGKAGLIITL